jgi:hypothetical protein
MTPKQDHQLQEIQLTQCNERKTLKFKLTAVDSKIIGSDTECYSLRLSWKYIHVQCCATVVITEYPLK